MSAYAEIAWDGVKRSTQDQRTIDTEWLIFDTEDESVAEATMLDAASVSGATEWNPDDLPIRKYDITRRLGENVWLGSVQFSTHEPPKEGRGTNDQPTELNVELEFDTSGGTAHITQSKETVANYARPTFTPPNFKQAIGVTDDSVEGCDIVVPQFAWSETHDFVASSVNATYIGHLYAVTGTVNSGSFKTLLGVTFAAGEVLFLGAQGRKKGQETWSITFKFLGSPNVTGQTIGDITGIAKGGHHYLWTRFEPAIELGSGRLIKHPGSVHIERVYEAGAFSTLGIEVS